MGPHRRAAPDAVRSVAAPPRPFDAAELDPAHASRDRDVPLEQEGHEETHVLCGRGEVGHVPRLR